MSRFSVSFRRLAAAATLPLALLAAPAETAGRRLGADQPVVPFLGGVGGVYFLAEPGELEIEIDKRDLNRRDVRTELRAILVGPNRTVLQEATIPDDGQPRGKGPGPVQTCRLVTRVERKGVYAVNITVSQDRYGEEMVWRFRTNCARYLIETARGHKDERHQEPIVLAAPEQRAEVCFWPRTAALRLDLARLPAGVAAPQIVDSSGSVLATLQPDANGAASHEFGAEPTRAATPWRVRLPAAQATIGIDGVTRWDSRDQISDLCCWTPNPTSWFPLLENRWLLTPYRRAVYGRAGERKDVTFQIRNDAADTRTINLALEFDGAPWPVQLSTTRVQLAPRQSQAIVASGTWPATGQSRTVHVRATPEGGSGFTTYSSLIATAGVAPASPSLTLPLVLQAYQHENEQFGHLPDFPTENQVYFDGRNRPYVRTSTGVARREDGAWINSVVDPKSSPAVTKITFDRENRIYVLGHAGPVTSLYTSTDGGRTFVATPIPARERPARSFDLEEFTGHNPLDGPPPIVRFTQTAKDEKLFWRSLNDLELFVPRWENGRVVLGEPILITRQCIGLASHSGIPASVVSRGRKVHLVWGEATDPEAKAPGVPACAATYDRETGAVTDRAVLGYGPPANDIHNSPSITMDRGGLLHVLGGTHGRPFPYAHSLQPNEAGAGWTPAVVTGEGVNQTYIGLVCGPDDTLHAVFRYWRYHAAPFPLSTHATLAYQRKRPGQPWEAPQVLVVSPFSEYSVFYHRLTIDRRGRLFVSYDYWSTFWFYRNDHFGRRRTLLASPDGGTTWKLADSGDL